MCTPARIAVRIALARRGAHAGGLADEMFVGHPQFGGPHEGLVVKSGGQKTRQGAIDLVDIEPQVGPAVLAGGLQAMEKFRRGGQGVGFLAVAAPQFHQGVGLFHASGEDAPGPVVFEASTDQAYAVGQQSRGQGIAGMALHGSSIEDEGKSSRPIDMATLRQAPGLVRHGSRSPSAGAMARTS